MVYPVDKEVGKSEYPKSQDETPLVDRSQLQIQLVLVGVAREQVVPAADGTPSTFFNSTLKLRVEQVEACLRPT